MTTPAEEQPLTAVTDPNNVRLVIPAVDDESDVDEVEEAEPNDDAEDEELTAAADYSTSGMIALLPTVANAERLYAGEDDFGELADDLHATVIYLGDITGMDERTFSTIVDELVSIADEEPGPVVAEGFNVALFNPHSDERDTCVTLGLSGSMLHRLCKKIRERIIDKIAGESFPIPEQHEPFIPHVTLAYTDDYSTVERLADRTGDITFDRIRLAIGDEVYDIDIEPTGVPGLWNVEVEQDDSDIDVPEDVAYASSFARTPFDESKHVRGRGGRFAPKISISAVDAEDTRSAGVADLPPAEGYPFAVRGDFPQMSDSDARAMQSQMTQDSPPPWTSTEKDAIYDYSTSAYQDVNNCLRFGTTCSDEPHPDWGYVTNNIIRDVSSSMRPTTQPLTTFRQANLASLGVSSPDELISIVGQQGIDRGFASSTLDSTFAGLADLDDFAGTPEVKMQIEIPAGTSAAYVAPVSEWPEQQELILAPGSRYEILEVQPASAPGETSFVRVRVIPNGS